MKALVIGGTGFIGPWICRQLLAHGVETAVFHRGRTTAPEGTKVFTGERSAFDASWPEIAEWGPDTVIDVRCMTEIELDCVLPSIASSSCRYVLISSVDVYRAFGVLLGKEPGPFPTPLTEESELRPTLYPYEDMPEAAAIRPDKYDKIPIERRVFSTLGERGVVLRLPMVYGPGDRQHRLWGLLRFMLAGAEVIGIPEALSGWKAPRSYVEDVGEAAALCAIHPEAGGQVFHVAEEPSATELAFSERVARGYGWQGELVVVPESRRPEWLEKSLDGAQDLAVDSSKIRALLGFREVANPEAAIKETIRWESGNPKDLADNAEIEQHASLRSIAAG